MEDVLDVSHRPDDADDPVVCMDEASQQLIGEVRTPLPVRPGQIAKYDSEYRREGTANIFMAVEPLAGFRNVQVTDRRTRQDGAKFIRHLLDEVSSSAKKVVLVMDNLNPHTIGSLYETFDAATARALSQRLEIRSPPKHGSWLPALTLNRGGDRTERSVPPVPGPSDRRPRPPVQGNRGLGNLSKRGPVHHRLAVHNRRCPHQTQETLSIT